MKLPRLCLALMLDVVPAAALANDDAGLTSDEPVLLQQYVANKRAIYQENLTLTDAESAAFWPIYDQYEAELKVLDDRFVELINLYAAKLDSLTDAEASAMLNERLEIDRKRVDLRVKYCQKVDEVLPGIKALRFSQIDTRIRNAQLSNLYSILPLAH